MRDCNLFSNKKSGLMPMGGWGQIAFLRGPLVGNFALLLDFLRLECLFLDDFEGKCTVMHRSMNSLALKGI